jgi:hypothetical protein
MKNQSSLPELIPLFQSVEEHLHHHDLELALSSVRSILARDGNNYYARAIERRIVRVLYFQEELSEISDSTEYYIDLVAVALENVCQMAVRYIMNLPVEASSSQEPHVNRHEMA